MLTTTSYYKQDKGEEVTVPETIWQNSSKDIFPSPSLSASIIVLSTIYL